MRQSAIHWDTWIMAAGPSQCQTSGGTNDKAGVAWNSTTLREKVAPAFVHHISLELQSDSVSFLHVSCDFKPFGCLDIWFGEFISFGWLVFTTFICDDCLAFWHNLLRPSLLYHPSVKRRSNSLELTVEEEVGDVIYWTITRQMYHIREKCPIHTATSMGRTARSCDVCQACRPEIGVPVTVSSTGSKYHRRDCHTVSKSTPLVLVRCPICFDIKAEWLNL